jgi:hypothetical protein
MLDLSGTKNKLIDAINIVKRVRIFRLEEFLFFTKAPYISSNIPLINKINSGNIELKFEKNIIC